MLEDINYGLLAWGWYAVTAFSKNIPSSDKNRAIRLRKHNIQIGDSDLLHKFFKEKRGNDYFYGEIHLSHKELRPDTDRTGLVPTPEALRLQELLKEKFIKLDKLYHLASEAKSAIKDIDYGVRKEKDIIDIEEKDVLKTKIEDGLLKLDKVGTKATTFGTDAASKLYEIYKDKAENIVKEPHSNDEKQKLSMPMSTPISVKPPSPIVITDIFEPLKEKFNDSEVKLIRKIFVSIRKNCPTANITLIEDIKKKVIKELSK